jgi:hypothetical protein
MNKTAQTSIKEIKDAIDLLKAKGVTPTQLNISSETGLSIRTIKRHWTVVKDKDRLTEKPKHKALTDFERFRRRVERSPIQVYQCSPDMF